MLFIVLSLTAGILYGITETINKNITEKKYAAISYAFLQSFFNFLLYLVAFIFAFSLPPFGIVYVYFAVITVIVIIANTLFIRAYKTEDVSNVSIVSRVSLIISFISGGLLLGEKVTLFKIMGLVAILIGIIVIFYEGKRPTVSKGLLLTVFAGILWGFLAYFNKLTLQITSLLTYVTVTQLTTSVPLLFLPQVRRDAPKIIKKHWRKFFLSRLTAVAAIFLFVKSIQNGAISVVSTNFEAAFLLTSVGMGIFLLEERKGIRHKILGSTLCIAGIVLLNFF